MYTNYTLEQHLANICEENSQYCDLLNTWGISKRIIREMLSSIPYNYTYYSKHDGTHSEKIITNIEMILGEERIKQLSPTDTWIILNIAYLHDIGMILPYSIVENKWCRDKDFECFFEEALEGEHGEDVQEAASYIKKIEEYINDKKWPLNIRRYVTIINSTYFRRGHAELSNNYIQKNIDDYVEENLKGHIKENLLSNSIIQTRLYNLIGKIACLHTKDFSSVMKLEYITNGFKSDYIHPRFLAILLRVGDLLDIEENRFDYTRLSVGGKVPQLSKLHILKHQAINHLLISPKNIEISAKCNDDKVYRLCKGWFDWLKKEIHMWSINWNNIVPENFTGSAPSVEKLNVSLDDSKDIELTDLRMNFEREDAFKLLQGNNIYKNKLDFIRELVQNSIDAMKLQFWSDLNQGYLTPYLKVEDYKKENFNFKKVTPFNFKNEVFDIYNINVNIKYQDDKIVVIVEDNGTGISIEDVKDLSKVGRSWYNDKRKKNLIKLLPSWLKPTGAFGIGLQSCFRVTDEIEILTKTSKKEGNKLIIKSPVKQESYVYVEKNYELKRRGTRIIIKIDPSKFSDEIDILDKSNLEFITDYLDRELVRTIFDIRINGHLLKDKDNTYNDSKIFDESCLIEEDQYSYKFLKQDKSGYGTVIIWDNDNGIYCESKLKTSNNLDVFFGNNKIQNNKGKIITINTISLSNKLYILGLQSKKYLEISREYLRDDNLLELENLIGKLFEFILKIFQRNQENIINQAALPYLYIDLINNSIEFDKQKFIEKVHSTEIVKYFDGHKCNEKNIKDILTNYPNVTVMNSADLIYTEVGSITSQVLENNDIEEIFGDSGYKFYITNDKIYYSLLHNFELGNIAILNKDRLSKHYYKPEFTIVKIDRSDKLKGVDADEQAKKLFMLELISSVYNRRAIIGLDDYRNIVVNKVPNKSYLTNITTLGYSRYIISPFNSSDLGMYREVDVETIAEDIFGRDYFKNLIEYVKDNNISKSVTIKQIEEDYRKLIGDYYHIASATELENRLEKKD